jgi:NADH pyrophosphatase NudC (nudix superfamily)
MLQANQRQYRQVEQQHRQHRFCAGIGEQAEQRDQAQGEHQAACMAAGHEPGEVT